MICIPFFIQYEIKTYYNLLRRFFSKINVNKEYKKQEIESLYLDLINTESEKTKAVKINLILNFFRSKKIDEGYIFIIKPIAILANKFNFNEQLVKEVLYLDQCESIQVIPIVLEYLSQLKRVKGRINIKRKKELLYENIKPFMIKYGYDKYLNNALNKAHRVLNNLEFVGLLKKQGNNYIFTDLTIQYKLYSFLIYQNYKKSTNVSINGTYDNEFSKYFLLDNNVIDDYLEKMRKDNIITLTKRANLNYFNLKVNKLEDLFNAINQS